MKKKKRIGIDRRNRNFHFDSTSILVEVLDASTRIRLLNLSIRFWNRFSIPNPTHQVWLSPHLHDAFFWKLNGLDFNPVACFSISDAKMCYFLWKGVTFSCVIFWSSNIRSKDSGWSILLYSPIIDCLDGLVLQSLPGWMKPPVCLTAVSHLFKEPQPQAPIRESSPFIDGFELKIRPTNGLVSWWSWISSQRVVSFR